MPTYKAVVDMGEFALEVSGSSAHEVVAGLTEMRNSEVAALIGNIRSAAPGQEAMGNQLGARLVEEVPNDSQPAQQVWTWGDQSNWDQSQRDMSDPHHNPPTPPPGAQVVPGSPKMPNGQFAWLVTTTKQDGTPARAFVQPEVPSPEFNALPKTDDPRDPRIGKGTARYFQIIE